MTNKLLFLSAKVSAIVIITLTFMSCESEKTILAVTSDLNVTLNATNNSGTIEFQATITNNDSATADIVFIEFYRNEVIAATSDQEIKLHPKQIFSYAITDTPAEPGNYSYKICVKDVNNYNFCTRESNFSLFPELSISGQASTKISSPNIKFYLIVEVTNDGSRFSPPTQIDFFRSLSNTFDISINIRTTSIGNLSTDESVSNRAVWQESRLGNYFYRACVRSVLGERNSNNNCTSAIEIEISDKADVSIDGIKVSSTDIRVGEKVTISTEVKNIGFADASETTIQFYRSIDGVISEADMLLSSVPVSALVVGASMDIETTTISKLGRFYYGVCVEQLDASENINNNCSHGIFVNSQLLWKQATVSADWSVRYNHTSLIYDNKIWVLGGWDGSDIFNDVWYSTDGNNWQQATASADWSVRRSHTSLVYDNKMWVLGGADDSNKNDVWYSTNGINWQQATANAAWTARSGYTSLIFDNKMWVLGGIDGSTYRNDVWYSTDGRNWQQATADAAWSARSDHASLVYDNKMWVLGGIASNIRNDIWYSTDGVNWVQATDDVAWSSRFRHTSLVYDDKMWVLGGWDRSRRNDVWYSTNGINWEQATDNADWLARWSHTSLIFDNKMWVLGGDDGFNRSDVWFTFIQDSTDRGIELGIGEKVSSYLAADEKEYYSLQLSAGSYQIATEGVADTLCSLYNTNNELLASNDNGGSGNNCSFIFSTSASEDVYLRVQISNIADGTSITGSYSLSIVPVAPDVNIRSLADIGNVYEGVDFQITTGIQNIGISTADSVTIKYYLTPNSQISPTGNPNVTPNSISNITDIRAGAISTNTSSNIRINSVGNYYYGICLETVNELNLTNNCLFQPVTVLPKPDITVSVLAPDTIYLDNITEEFNLQTTLTNQGGHSEPFILNYYKSSREITTPESSNLISSSDIAVTNHFSRNGETFYRIQTIIAGATRDANTNITVRDEGIFYYGVCVEAVRGEETTADNCASQRVTIVQRIDTSISNFQINSSITTEEVQFTLRVQNHSPFVAYNTTIRYFRSTDTFITTGDVEIGRMVLDLAGNTTSNIVLDFILGNESHYYGACINNNDNTLDNNCSNAVFVGGIGSFWQQTTRSASWAARNFHTSLVYDNKMWVLGGFTDSRKNDVWDSTNGINWREVTATADWSGRSSHASLVYDNKMWVLGGYDGSRKNDVWYSTDGINWQQATGSAAWSARNRHTSLTFDNKMWVLGGFDSESKNDVWYSTDGINWEQATRSAAWSARESYASLVYDNKMWVLGGWNGRNILNDVWYSRDGINWEQATANADWSGRNSHTSLVYDNKMWVLGGWDGSRKNDVWYSRDGINWEQAIGSIAWSARNNHTSYSYDNKIWMLGGNDGSNKNDVWFTFIQDSTEDGIELVLGEKVSSLLTAGEKEYYNLQLSAGRYQITTEGSTDTLCSLYNTINNELLASNNNGGRGENCSFIFSTNTSEDVYLLVQGADSGITGNYSLTIVPIAPDINIRSLDIGTLGTNIFYEGEHLQITAQIQNIGTSTADNVRIKYYFPQNSQINPTADTPDYIFNIASLGAGVIVTNISNDISVDAGDYYYGVCLETANELNLTNNCAFKFQTVTFLPKPDIVVNVSAPNIVYLDGPTATFKLAMTFRNQGGTSEPIVFNYYRSSTAITIPDNSNLISNSDIRAISEQFSKNGTLFYRVRGIASATTYSDATTDITVRSRGVFHYGVCIENVQGEDNTADNCASQRVVVINRADANNSRLNSSITQFKTDKNRIAVGEEVTFTASVQNNSVSPENNILINYFRSSDNIITTGDIGIGSDFLATLAANTTQDISLNFTLRERGYYGACVVGSISVNNCSNAVFIVPIAPDINIRSLDIGTLGTNVFYEGEHLQITAQIQNIGTSTADNVTIKYYFPQNSQINPTTDTPDYIFNIASLGDGVIVTNISNDISVDNGDYYYGVCLETANELNLTNNCAFKFQTVTFQPKPDIAVNVSAPNVVYLDDSTATFKLAMTFRNQGGTSEPIVFNYYRSSTAITIPDSSNLISNSDIRAISEQFSKNGAIFYRVRGIASGTTYSDATTDITVRSRGIFHYGVCIENVQGEDNTADNCASQRVVVINRADANNSRLNSSITQFKTDKSRIAAGEEVTFTASIQNNSVSPENNIFINYFRSSDNIITTGDIEIGSDFLDTLAANTTQDISLNFTLRERGYYGACVAGSISVNNCSNAIFIEVIGNIWQQAVENSAWHVRDNFTSLVYNNKIWVLGGGYDGRNRLNDVWDSTDGANWQQVTDDAGWSARYNHTSLVYNNKMWVLGGWDGSMKNDVWYSKNGNNWEQATASAVWSARNNHTSLVYNNKMWVLGGWDGFNSINDVWDSTNGVNWRQVTASAGWSGRNHHTSLVYNNKMWVLGGFDRDEINDVWYSTDGMNWEQTTLNAAWSDRSSHTSLVYDNKMWVLGGNPVGSIHYNDVWYSRDGINWQQATGNAGWSDRSSHTSLVYDNKMWVLGGNDDTNTLNDVWYSTASNNTIDSALALSLKSSGNDYSSDAVVVNLQAGAEDYYKFQFNTGNYIIETSSDIGTSCSLYNSGRVVITTNTNSSTDECLLTHTATATADFYLQVKGNTANTTGIYQLLIRKNTTSAGRTSIRVATSTILQGTRQSGQKSALNAEFQPQIQGRLEVLDPITKEHGTVCSDSFGIQDAIVACRELGFSDGYVIPAAQIEDGTGVILLDDLHCIGDEESLLDCQHNGLKVHNCIHAEDIGIACY